MENIISFAEKKWERFEESPFCEVDSLILSWMSYLHFAAVSPEVCTFRGLRFSELFRAECFEALVKDVWRAKESIQLLTAMAASPRYRDMRVGGFVEQTDKQEEKQFAAVCFKLCAGEHYIAFRGTDTSLTGWKEDFNMAFQYPVPSQEDAAAYLLSASKKHRGTLRTGGHSKGGNLALCAAMSANGKLKKRIAQIYSHDGPGFLPEVMEGRAFLSVQKKIRKTLPQGSIIGLLMEQKEDFRIVRSNQSSIWQHDPFSWEIEDGDFCYLEDLTPHAKYVNHTISEWLNTLSEEERERFVDVLYDLVNVRDVDSFPELFEDWKTNIPAILQAISALDKDTGKFILQTVKELAVLGVRNIPEVFRRGKKKGKSRTLRRNKG